MLDQYVFSPETAREAEPDSHASLKRGVIVTASPLQLQFPRFNRRPLLNLKLASAFFHQQSTLCKHKSHGIQMLILPAHGPITQQVCPTVQLPCLRSKPRMSLKRNDKRHQDSTAQAAGLRGNCTRHRRKDRRKNPTPFSASVSREKKHHMCPVSCLGRPAFLWTLNDAAQLSVACRRCR